MVLVVVLVVVVHSDGWWYNACSTGNVNKVSNAVWKVVGAEHDVEAACMLVKLS